MDESTIRVDIHDLHDVALLVGHRGSGKMALMSWRDAVGLAYRLIVTAEKVRDDIGRYAKNNPDCNCEHCEDFRQNPEHGRIARPFPDNHPWRD